MPSSRIPSSSDNLLRTLNGKLNVTIWGIIVEFISRCFFRFGLNLGNIKFSLGDELDESVALLIRRVDEGRLSQTQVTVNLMKCAVGAGSFSVPYAFMVRTQPMHRALIYNIPDPLLVPLHILVSLFLLPLLVS
jgi:hypothetical protein